MNFSLIILSIIIGSIGIFTANAVHAEIDIINDIEFLKTGIIFGLDTQFNISNEIEIREFFNGKILRVSGQTIEGFPYITYSTVLDNVISTRGIIFINNEFVDLKFTKRQTQEQSIIEKNQDISIIVKYTQRTYSNKFVQIDMKIFDSEQNILNDFNQNYGYVTNTSVNVIVKNDENKEYFTDNGITNERGFFSTTFFIPENLRKQTLTVTIIAENEDSKSSKILQLFNLGRIPNNSSP